MASAPSPVATARQLWPYSAFTAAYFAHAGFFGPFLPLWLKDMGLGILVISLLTSVQSAFDSAYPQLGAYFRAIVRDRWIESEKRPNKRGGAFLTGSPVTMEPTIEQT
mgnify:CR=1 FL=1